MMYNRNMQVVGLIADIIDSKEIEDRKKFQEKLICCLDQVSRSSSTVLSPYTVTLGDEFQAVYKNGSEVLDHILYIQVQLFPVRIRFSIGYGEISTNINTEQAIGMDGPMFHYARDGMNDLKNTNYSIVSIRAGNENDMERLNSGLALAFAIMSDWKHDTLRIFYELYKDKAVKEILPHFDLSQRGMYKLINRNKLWEFLRYFRCLRGELKMMKG